MDFHIFLAWIPPISSWSRHPATKNQEVMQEFVQSHLVSTLNPIHEAGSCENAPIEGFQKPHSKHKYISWYVTVFKEWWLSVFLVYMELSWSYMELYGVIQLSSYQHFVDRNMSSTGPLGLGSSLRWCLWVTIGPAQVSARLNGH